MRTLKLVLATAFLISTTGAWGETSSHKSHDRTSPPPSDTKDGTRDEPRATVQIPTEQQSRMGVTLASAEEKAVDHTIRTVGTISADQRREAHVHTRLNGWIEVVHADFVGKQVKEGQPLFDLYSPELVSTQEEYLVARKQGDTGKDIAQASLERLRGWGVPESEIESLKQRGRSKRTVTFRSPVSGYVVSKTALKGMYVTPEMELYYLADLSQVWIVLTLYESDLAAVAVGDMAQVQLPYDPRQSFSAKISYIYPEVDLESRTAKARLELSNPKLALKPGMFANVQIAKRLGRSILIPDDSVIDTGTRHIVFVKASETAFEPREIVLGPRVGDQYAVLGGLKAGEQVVTSAHFLIDAESKFQAALQKGAAPSSGGGHSGHGGG